MNRCSLGKDNKDCKYYLRGLCMSNDNGCKYQIESSEDKDKTMADLIVENEKLNASNMVLQKELDLKRCEQAPCFYCAYRNSNDECESTYLCDYKSLPVSTKEYFKAKEIEEIKKSEIDELRLEIYNLKRKLKKSIEVPYTFEDRVFVIADKILYGGKREQHIMSCDVSSIYVFKNHYRYELWGDDGLHYTYRYPSDKNIMFSSETDAKSYLERKNKEERK